MSRDRVHSALPLPSFGRVSCPAFRSRLQPDTIVSLKARGDPDQRNSGSRIKRVWRRTSLMQRLAFVRWRPRPVTPLRWWSVLTRHQLITLHAHGPGTADAIATQAASVAGRAPARHAPPGSDAHRPSIADISISHVQIRAADGEILADSSSRNEPLKPTES